MLVKIYGQEPGAGPERKYSPGECIGIRKEAINGNPDMVHVSTSSYASGTTSISGCTLAG